MHRISSLILTASLLPLLASCQTGGPVLSLEEAKKATAEFSGSYTPPPRTINDIMAPIREQNLGARGCTGSPPMSDEQVREMMSSLASLGKNAVAKFAQSQAEFQFQRGNYPRSIEYLNMAIDKAPENPFWSTVNYAQLASYYAFAGDVDEAEDALSYAGSDLARIQRYSGNFKPRSLDIIFFNLNLARAPSPT